MAERRFAAGLDTILRDLAATLVRMGTTGTRIECGGRWTKEATRLLERQRYTVVGEVLDLYPVGVRITIMRRGKAYPYACATYPHVLDNFRAAQRTITALYQCFEDYGVSAGAGDAFDAIFGAVSEALARVSLGDGTRPWWQTLGVPPDADRASIAAAHRHLALVSHPDRGGDAATMARVNAARDEGLRALAGRRES